MISRRDFLKRLGIGAAGAAVPFALPHAEATVEPEPFSATLRGDDKLYAEHIPPQRVTVSYVAGEPIRAGEFVHLDLNGRVYGWNADDVYHGVALADAEPLDTVLTLVQGGF